jgi:hypothetical protein
VKLVHLVGFTRKKFATFILCGEKLKQKEIKYATVIAIYVISVFIMLVAAYQLH